MSMPRTPVKLLSDDAILQIFSHASLNDNLALSRTSSQWNQYLNSDRHLQLEQAALTKIINEAISYFKHLEDKHLSTRSGIILTVARKMLYQIGPISLSNLAKTANILTGALTAIMIMEDKNKNSKPIYPYMTQDRLESIIGRYFYDDDGFDMALSFAGDHYSQEQDRSPITRKLIHSVGKMVLSRQLPFDMPYFTAQVDNSFDLSTRPSLTTFLNSLELKDMNKAEAEAQAVAQEKIKAKASFVEDFKKVYLALRDAQSTPSLFKSNFIADIESLPIEEQYNLIMAHKQKKGSRTEMAYNILSQEYTGQDEARHRIVQQIHEYAYAQSGLFSRTSHKDKLAKAAGESDKDVCNRIIEIADENPESRTGKIVKALWPQ